MNQIVLALNYDWVIGCCINDYTDLLLLSIINNFPFCIYPVLRYKINCNNTISMCLKIFPTSCRPVSY